MIIEKRPATKKELRNFGLVVGIAFGVFATIQLVFHGKIDPRILYGISGFLIVSGLIVPQILRPFNFLWMKLALVLGYVMNRILLGFIFFIVFTFVATIMRLIKRDALRLRKEKGATTFWLPKKHAIPGLDRYERQF